MRAQHTQLLSPRRQRGYSLIELSITVLIALFLLGGLLVVVQDNKRTFGNQTALAQLQDNERLAMSMMTDIIQSAGYFPDPTANTAVSAFPQVAPFTSFAGQAIVGTGALAAGAPGDTVTVRFRTNSNDTIINCAGLSNKSGAPQTYVNAFAVVNGQLVCTMNGTTYPLIGSPTLQVYKLQVEYGVNRGGGAANNVDTYVDAANMAAADWQRLISVKITLWFVNPLYNATQTGQAQYLSFMRVIDVMSVGGVST